MLIGFGTIIRSDDGGALLRCEMLPICELEFSHSNTGPFYPQLEIKNPALKQIANPEYNYMYIDALFDFLGSIGIKPFVELGFIPSALASTCS
jgi:hypothetical protein